MLWQISECARNGVLQDDQLESGIEGFWGSGSVNVGSVSVESLSEL